MNIVTDIYEYIACLADATTTLNMLSVNKKFLDENYYRRVIQKKYPYLANIKKHGEPFTHKYVFKREHHIETYNYVLTWRQCYIKNLKFILKIEEIFNLPYFHVKHFFPERLLQRLSREKNPYSFLLHRALEQGRADIRDIILERNLAVPTNSNLSASCRSGNVALVKETYNLLSTKLRKIDLQPGISNSVSRGNLDVLNFLLEKGNNTDLNYALLRSCGKENDTMKHLISKGANNFTDCIIFLHQRLNDSKNFKVKPEQLNSLQKYISSLQNNLEFLRTYTI